MTGSAPDNAARSGGPAIRLSDVSKTYPGTSHPVVDQLSLEVEEGQIIALVGPSGCGKTTTLKMINRLIEPTSGTIEVLGKPQGALVPHVLRRHIGYVIQQVGLFPHLKIGRNIGVVCELLGWTKKDIAQRAAELAELVGLDRDMLDRYPAELSGGQQQRVGVARALAADPPILLMDEPYSAVDPIVRERLQDDLLALQTRMHKTIVIVTHDVDEAIKLGDRVAIMQIGGHIAQYDQPSEVLRAPASEFVAEFLGRERGLRRLSLLNVGDVEPFDGPAVDLAATVQVGLQRADKFLTGWVAVVSAGKLVGWVHRSDMEAAVADTALSSLPRERFVTWVTDTTPLREALDVIIGARSRMAVVVDATDQVTYRGFVDVNIVAGGLEV